MRQLFLFISVFLFGLISGCGPRQAEDTVKPVIPVKAREFDLADVQLHDGPFLKAMERNAEYLMFLEPDRFLAWFRSEAGLEPKGEVYGGWESEGYVLAGHSLGHYISALSKHYCATGDEDIKQKLDYVIEELALVQEQHGDGYLSAIPDGRMVFEEISERDIRPKGFSLNDANVPWYNLDKPFNGLKDAYLLGGN